MMKTRCFLFLMLAVLLTGCYNRKQTFYEKIAEHDEILIDSVPFVSTHYYTKNYNFIVNSDSLSLLTQIPEEQLWGFMTDTMMLQREDLVVVADVRIVPADKVDSVWICLARDEQTIGWVQEKNMLRQVVPDDPISQFIALFSNRLNFAFLSFGLLLAVLYVLMLVRRKKIPVVHFNDIPSFYPTLLCLMMAVSATFYASVRMFANDTWESFYFSPTLNPLIAPPLLSVFIASVWLIIIAAIAALDVVIRSLKPLEAIVYSIGLFVICVADYLLFSVTTQYYIGYLLLLIYVVFSLVSYFRHSRTTYLCGACGSPLLGKGRCPFCGAINN